MLGPFIGYQLLKRHRDREIRRILREREAYRRRSRYAEPPIIIRQSRRKATPKPTPQPAPTPQAKKPARDPDNLDIVKDTEALDDLLEQPATDDASPYVFRELKEKHDVLRELEHESIEIPAQSKVLGIIALILVVAAQVGVIWWWLAQQ